MGVASKPEGEFPAGSLNSGERSGEAREIPVQREQKLPPKLDTCERRAQARTLQTKITAEATLGWRDPTGKGRSIGQQLLEDIAFKLVSVVGLVDEDGMPAATVPSQEVSLSWLDPEGKGRSLAERVDEINAKAEAELIKHWEAQRNAAG